MAMFTPYELILQSFWSLETTSNEKGTICWSKLCPVTLKVNVLDQWVSLLRATWPTIELKNNGALCSDAKTSSACQSQQSHFLKLDKRLQETINTQCRDFYLPLFRRQNTFHSFHCFFSLKTEDRWGGAINCPRISRERPSGRSSSAPPGKQNRWKDGEKPACLQEVRLYFPQSLEDKHQAEGAVWEWAVSGQWQIQRSSPPP